MLLPAAEPVVGSYMGSGAHSHVGANYRPSSKQLQLLLCAATAWSAQRACTHCGPHAPKPHTLAPSSFAT